MTTFIAKGSQITYLVAALLTNRTLGNFRARKVDVNRHFGRRPRVGHDGVGRRNNTVIAVMEGKNWRNHKVNTTNTCIDDHG